MDFSKLLLYIPGIIIFLVGSGQVRDWLRIRRADFCVPADVTECAHIVKKDKKERNIYDYYNVTVEYRNPQTKHTERQAVKSPTEYAVAQQVKVFREKNAREIEIMPNKNEFVFDPWTMMIGGALLILLALEENRGNEVRAMICLSLVIFGAGVCMIKNYVSAKRRGLVPLEGEVISVYTRQLSKGTKIIKSDRFTYYPIVRYSLDGKENIRRCSINSGSEKAFKPGDRMKLYYDPEEGAVFEKNAGPAILIAGIALSAAGLLAGISILSQFLSH